VELSATHGEDGRLLRMFVSRSAHKKPDARQAAAKAWLIREDFYDEWVEEYARRYAPAEVPALEDEEAPGKNREFLKVFEDVLKKKPEVDRLEKNVQESKGDVFMLRDALLAAVKELRSPKRRLGLQGENKMSPEAIEALKFRRQERLREVVRECLEGIWRSGVGGELLKVAMDHVHVLIERFEEKADDVRNSTAGPCWHKLKNLVSEIEDELPETRSQKAKAEIEGRNTKQLVQRALEDLGGKASTQEIFGWIEEHPEVLEEHGNLKINKRVSGEKSVKGKEVRVWHNTVRGVLSVNFQKSTRKRQDGVYVWTAKGAADPEPAALQDGSPEERPDAPKRKRARPKAKETPLALAAGDAAEGDAEGSAEAASPKAKAKRKPRAAKGNMPDAEVKARGAALGAAMEDALNEASAPSDAAAAAAGAAAAPPEAKRPRTEGGEGGGGQEEG